MIHLPEYYCSLFTTIIIKFFSKHCKLFGIIDSENKNDSDSSDKYGCHGLQGVLTFQSGSRQEQEDEVRMKLERLTERIWIFPFEEERDRPILGYIRGDHWSLAVDAGHSSAHTEDYYRALQEEELPMPALTVLTHWHWDHTFGMHAVTGLTLANQKTNSALTSIRDEIDRSGREHFLSLDYKIRNEYAGNIEIVVKNADMVFSGEIILDAGNCPIRVFQAESPHTDDSTLIAVPHEKTLFWEMPLTGLFPHG